MRPVIIIAQLLLLITLASAQGPEKVISCQYHQVLFHTFCQEIFNTTGVRIYYDEKWVNHLTVTLESDSISVKDAVTLATKDSGLEVSVWSGNLVLLPGEKLLTGLPAYENKFIKTDSAALKGNSLTAAEERYLTGRMPDAIQTIKIGRTGNMKGGVRARILGRVLDQETGAPVFSATVYIAEIKTGEVTDINGFFTIMLKPGKYNAIFEFLGYEKKKYQLEVLSDGDFIVTLKRAVIQMKEFVVYGDRQSSMKAKDPGLEKISMKAIKELPMMMGERDILKISGMLPGIVSTGEGTSGLNVRGGSSDQNAFYINKIPIYNTSHLFGFFPAFNADIIKDFSIYKGHIPAQYGGRLSSVFNIVSRQGNRKHITARGGLSPVTGSLVLEGPLKKDTCSVILSARSSYSDWILTRLNDPDIRSSSAGFYDFTGGFNYDIRKTQIAAFAYHSYDRFRLSDISDFDYSNSGASFTLGHVFSNSVRGEFSLIGSRYAFGTTNKQELSAAYTHSYLMNHYEVRTDFWHLLSDVHTLEYGFSSILYKLDRGQIEPFGSGSLLSPVGLGNEQGLESAAYVSDSWDIFPWLNLTSGLRYAMFNPLGPQTVYTYTPGSPIDTRYINDSLNFGKNQPIRWYSEPDLRVAINIETDANGSVKLAFNQMHQNLFMLNNTISISPNAQWKLADYHLKPSKSSQFSLGVFRLIENTGLEVSIEGYYKQTFNSPEFVDGADFLESPQVETTVLQGGQNAWGLEVFVKRSSRKLEGWISYTYSRSKVTVNGEHAWNRINDGETFPANFDIPHALNVVVNYHFTRRITLSSVIAYQTGKPITYPTSVYYVNGMPVLDYSARNAYRIPDYFRTDVSLAFEGNLKKRKLLHSSFILNLFNMTGRENPYAVYFKTENGGIRSYQYSVIGVPVFTATWLFKLGNYASE
jgi:hypothetical protein